MPNRYLSPIALAALLALLLVSPLRAQADKQARTGTVVEIRSYNLQPGTRDAFHKRFVEKALPMLHRFKVDVVAYGPSLADADSYFLIRSFPSVEARQKSEDAFYGSDEWKQGIREATLADIVNYTTIVRSVDADTLRSMRKLQNN